ncbi:unnamed protein product [Phyllotreta striolata]|uniref:LisH domain-containing protein n=1 Tax=Phyllotreta striolata TaxID=444603 RepID=A0A9N9TRE2_PHYSR|nr:unnamed protein product [Phyllotreta striolata]
MDKFKNECDNEGKNELQGVLEVVLLFLKNNGFIESAKKLDEECKFSNITLTNISGNVNYKFYRNEELQYCDTNSVTPHRCCKQYRNNVSSLKQLHEDYQRLLEFVIKLHNDINGIVNSMVANLVQKEIINDSAKRRIRDISLILDDIIKEVITSNYKNSNNNESCIEIDETKERPNEDWNSNQLDENRTYKLEIFPPYETFKKRNERRQNSKKREKLHKNYQPKIPLCYLDVCRKLQSGCTEHCECIKCLPDQNTSRYRCSCYDTIRKELEEDEEHGTDSTTKQIFHSSRKEDPCRICKKVQCKCAFKSRPKIRRSPV